MVVSEVSADGVMMVSDDGKRFSVPATPFWMDVFIRAAAILSKSFSVLVPVRHGIPV